LVTVSAESLKEAAPATVVTELLPALMIGNKAKESKKQMMTGIMVFFMVLMAFRVIGNDANANLLSEQHKYKEKSFIAVKLTSKLKCW
jgi:hypothetical protein